jgi:hypothetical protein
MNRLRLLTGIILFGSLWGFSECIIGSALRDANLPAGAIMTGIFALTFMTVSRLLYKQPGMQLGMGLVAGALRLANPFGGCFICSAIAISAEAVLFELIWYTIQFDFSDIRTRSSQLSLGIITAYTCYISGFIVTQILTPIVSSAGFYIDNLIAFIPQILSRGLLAAILGGIALPAIMTIKDIDISTITTKVYYPVTATISILCWVAVIINTLLILGT